MSQTGRGLDGVTVRLARRDAEPAGSPSGRVFPNGSFFFVDVPPGEYELQAEGQEPANGRTLTAAHRLVLTSEHVSGLVLTLGSREPPAAPAAPLPPAAVPDATVPPSGGGPVVAIRQPAASSGRTIVTATRIETPPVIDGDLDDAAWQNVPIVDRFIQQLPNEGSPVSERTEVRIAFDRDNLYVAARCYDRDPSGIIAHEMKRDQSSISTKEDNVAVILDTFHDYRNGSMFIVTPKGSIHDLLITDERQFNWDWDTVWDASARMDDEGWSAEFVIPFKSLRYDLGAVPVWGINVRRGILRKGEHVFLTQIPRELGAPGAGRLSLGADLVGLDDVSESRHLEFKPFVTSGFSQDLVIDPDAELDGTVDGGLDVKYGLTDGLNLDLTYNTDFAQVESDTQQVNLTRFSLFFPEKRDFFLEGRDIYTFGLSRSGLGRIANRTLLFFSRRIGIDSGDVVPILAGARLTGRAGPYSLGLINMGTEEIGGSPTTNFTVARVKRDVLERSSVGAIFTNRAPVGGDESQALGVDATFRFGRGSGANFYLAKTSTAGVTDGQYSGRAQVALDVDRWGLEFDHLMVGEHFDPTIGFVRRRDIRSNFVGARFSPRLNRTWARRIFFTGGYDYTTDTDNVLQTRVTELGFEVESSRTDKLTFTARRNFENLDVPFAIQPDVVLPVGAYRFDDASARLTVGVTRQFSGYVDYAFGDFFSGQKRTLTISNVSKPTSHLAFAINYQRDDVDLPEGAFVTDLVGTKVDYAFTTRLFSSAFVQWNSDAELASLNLRLNYIYKLGSDLFVVYNENRNTGFGPSTLNRSLIVKLTYLLRM